MNRINHARLVEILKLLKETYPEGYTESRLRQKGYDIDNAPLEYISGKNERRDTLIVVDDSVWRITKFGEQYLRDLERDEILKEQMRFNSIIAITGTIIAFFVFLSFVANFSKDYVNIYKSSIYFYLFYFFAFMFMIGFCIGIWMLFNKKIK